MILVAPAYVEADGFPVEGQGFALRLCEAFRKEGLKSELFQLPKEFYEKVMTGRWKELGVLNKLRFHALLCIPRIDQDITLFLYDTARRRTDIVAFREWLPAKGPISALWEEIIGPHRDLCGFKLQVWTERSSYRIGEKLRIYIRAQRECFISVFILNSDGSVTSFLPMLEKRSNYILPGKTYSIPDNSNRPFELPLSGPPGSEYVKVLATTFPFDSDLFEKDLEPQELVALLADKLSRINPSKWAVATCRFTVKE